MNSFNLPDDVTDDDIDALCMPLRCEECIEDHDDDPDWECPFDYDIKSCLDADATDAAYDLLVDRG